ncbi:GNAT family N-acetyltransferase [Sphingomonas sp. TDK1]|uniref:GNAT family N-acetyltransferase n=1 Tax=Sphingomonas sp. TDK1 TaxID=453247 RepID=UPI0007D9E230|nr:GNAT family N-acetyltransferase [Sphingomonas sp. TDK1]OAN64933.1 hypothetical protein A7X12_16280 [Sphingomonas sp. TDK1]
MSESTELTTRGGVRLRVRPASPKDEPELADFFSHVAPDDLRFRFLTGLAKVRHEQLVAMLSVDHRQAETFVAFEAATETLVAVAMLAGDRELSTAEVAISVRADYKHKGVAWTLLDHAARFDEALGVGSLISIESRANREAIELEREMGFSVSDYPGDPTLVMVRRVLNANAAPDD